MSSNLELELLQRFEEAGLKLVVAESCTGGMLAGTITSVAGSSKIFDRGFVTYSNEAKTQMLGVDPELIATYGAVSSEVAIAMAKGALKFSLADYAISITGIAGPDGGSSEKPVGLVFIGFVRRDGETKVEEFRFKGSRDEIRKQAVMEGIRGVVQWLL